MAKKIVLDAGHGYNTLGKRTPKDMREWTMNDAICRYTVSFLADYDVTLTRCDDITGKTDVALLQRTNTINSVNPDLFISIHHNANTGIWGNWTGVETYSHPSKPKRDADLAKLFVDEMSRLTGLRNRGAKQADFHMIRETKSTIPSVLCEGGFMDSTIDEPVIISERGQKAYAQAVANVCISYLNLQKKTASPPSVPAASLYRIRKSADDASSQIGAYSSLDSAKKIADENKAQGYKVYDMSGNLIYNPNVSAMPIIGKPSVTYRQAQEWAAKKGATAQFITLAEIYWAVCGEVNPVVAYAQAALETGYGKFGGVINASYNNPCGLKTTNGGGDSDPSAHNKFCCWFSGVLAHIDHLALYAGVAGYPRTYTPDPRHFPYLYGSAKTVEELSGKWSTAESGEVIKRLISEMTQ